MPNDFYTPTGNPTDGSEITSATMRAEFAAINAGFNKLPTLTGNANKSVVVNSSGTGLDVTVALPMISSNNSIGIGTNAGVALTTGARNTLIGVDAGQLYTTTNNATCIGYRAGGFSVAASNHTALGAYAGEYNTSSGAVHIGYQAGRYAIGSGVVIIGNSAVSSASASAINNTVAIGSGALGGASFNAAQNVAIGANAGNAITTGTTNTIIGDNGGQILSTGSNNIILGYTATPSAGGVSNEVTLGNASITSFRIPGFGLTATGKTGTGSLVLSTAPTLTGLTVSGGTFVSRGITDNATAKALTLSGSGANSVTIANSATNPTIGTSAGGLNLSPGGALALAISAVASAVNYMTIQPSAAGGGFASIGAAGVDSDIAINISPKGTGSVALYGSSVPQVLVLATAAADRYITLTGSNGGNPTIGTSAGSLGIGSSLTMLQSNLGSFAAGEWSRDTNWGTYYKAPVATQIADVALFDAAVTTGVLVCGASATNPAFVNAIKFLAGAAASSSVPQVVILPTASSDRYITLTGSNGGNPTIGTSGGSLNIGAAVAFTAQTVGTTVGAAGGASALPATPLGYLTTAINGTACKVPYYTA